MTKQRICATTFLLICCLIGAFFVLDEPPVTDMGTQGSSVEDFDIILIAGRSIRSRFVRWFGSGSAEWSHVGVLHTNDGQVYILHATPDIRDGNAIQYEPIDILLKRKAVSRFRVIRLPELVPEQQEAVEVRFERIRAESLPFDYTFTMQDNGSIYCSELVLKIFPELICSLDISRTIYPGVFNELTNRIIIIDSSTTR